MGLTRRTFLKTSAVVGAGAYLASHGLKELRREGRIKFPAEAGHGDCVMDLTPFLTKPIDEAAVRKWERDTGLRRPKL